MTGKYRLRVKNKHLLYDIELKRKYTILRGDSGTGKTELCRLLSEGVASGNIISCDIDYIVVYSTGDIIDRLAYTRGKLFIMDEDVFDSNERRNIIGAMQKSDNYFLLITRLSLAELPISTKEIYELSTSKYTCLSKSFLLNKL